MSKLLPPIIIALTEEQEEAIEPFLAQLTEWDKAGRPGMCLAQVYWNHMVVGVIPHEKAKTLGRGDGETANSAFDRADAHLLLGAKDESSH